MRKYGKLYEPETVTGTVTRVFDNRDGNDSVFLFGTEDGFVLCWMEYGEEFQVTVGDTTLDLVHHNGFQFAYLPSPPKKSLHRHNRAGDKDRTKKVEELLSQLLENE